MDQKSLKFPRAQYQADAKFAFIFISMPLFWANNL